MPRLYRIFRISRSLLATENWASVIAMVDELRAQREAA